MQMNHTDNHASCGETDLIAGNKPTASRKRRGTAMLIAASAAALFLLTAGATGAGGADDMNTPAPAAVVPPSPANGPAPASTADNTIIPANAGAPAPVPTATPAAPTSAAPAPAAASSAPTTPSFVTNGLDADGGVRILSGKSTVLTTRAPYKRVSVGQPETADVNTIGPSTLLLTAKKAGTTQLIVWDDQDRSQVITVTVELDIAAVKRQLKQAFPLLTIEATPLNDTIALRGQMPSQQAVEQAVEMTSPFAKVHNFLEISGGQQVMLQVRFAEVSKSASRNLGVSFGGTDGVSSFASTMGQGSASFAGGSGAPLTLARAAGGAGTTLFGQGAFGRVAFDYFIDAMRQNGLVRNLAEPNLLVISGQEANFVAGGEVPVPVPQSGSGGGGSVTTIEYHEFGVRLRFTPLILGNGKIRLKVNPEVSDIDFSIGTTINGGPVPGFTKQSVNSTVELADGQSFALAGLLKNNVSANISAIPLLGDIPVIGQLFRSTKYQRKETELVVLVTPRLVEAMNPDQVPALPGESWRYPTGPQFFIQSDVGGPKVEPGQSTTDRKIAGPPATFHGTYGFTPVAGGVTAPSAR